MGVKFLTYVPDDAFISKFNNVSLAKIQGLSFVQWAGPYQSDYKLDSRLSAAANAALSKNQNPPAQVNILISPGATAAEIAGVKSRLSSVQSESDLRLGAILRGTCAIDNCLRPFAGGFKRRKSDKSPAVIAAFVISAPLSIDGHQRRHAESSTKSHFGVL